MLLLLILAMLSFGDVVAQGLGMAPVNPAFAEWQKKQKEKKVRQASGAKLLGSDVDESNFGLIPSVVDWSYLSDLDSGMQQAAGVTFPNRYDLRELGRVTSVKNQNPYGTCWAHAALGSLESWIKTSENIVCDFSENNMANLHGGDWTYNQGGNGDLATAYLVRWNGPVDEKDDPYANPNKSPSLSPVRHVQNVYMIPGKTGDLDHDGLKDAIMRFGGIYVSYKHYSSYYNSSTKSFYYNGSGNGNGHAVMVVGWDDNYSKSKFTIQPPGNGAYIVKNSWGTSWGENGYFYVSYYDTKFARSASYAFCNAENMEDYSSIYQYDSLGCVSSFSPSWGANMFTMTVGESLAAVGFYALVPNTSYTINVYVGCSTGAPISGTQKLTQSGKTEFAGFVTIPLSSTVPITKGQRFSIVLKLTTPGYGYPHAMEYAYSGYSSQATASSGQSFYSSNGSSWTDLTEWNSTANFCIKAYTKAATAPVATLSSIAIGGKATLGAGKSGTYTCTATYSDGVTKTVTPTWTISSGASYATVTSAGKVTAASTTVARSVTLRASFTDKGTTKTATKNISITATAPSAPSTLTASPGDATTAVRLNWTVPTGADKFSIWRATVNNSANAQCIQSEYVGTKYSDTEAIPGKDYWYWVKAGNGTGYSAFSSSASGWRGLGAPANVTASDNKYTDKIFVTWDGIFEGQTYYYRVSRAEGSSDGTKTVVRNWSTATTFEDSAVTGGVDYYYFVEAAVNSSGTRKSEFSYSDKGTVFVPVVPERLTISGVTSLASGGSANYTAKVFYSDGTSKSVTSTWTVTSGSVTSTGKLTAPTVYSNTKVTLSASYTEDGKTVRGTLDIVVLASAPSAPSTISAAAGKSVDGIAVQWGAGTGATGYTLWRSTSTSSSSAVQIATLGNVTMYTDTSATPGVDYTYWVKSVNATGMSGLSGTSATGWRKLSAPTGVAASDGAYTDKVLVSWGKVSGATHYRVSRATSASGTKTALGSWQTGLSYSDTSATAGTIYYYFVTAAVNSSGTRSSDTSAADSGARKVAVTLSSIEISGPSSVAASKTATYGCTAKYSDGTTKSVTPTWSVSGSATINTKGLLTASAVTSDSAATVTASFTDSTTKTATKSVKIVAPQVASATVSNVKLSSRWPWNGWVDVDYTLKTSPAGALALVSLSGQDHDLGRALAAKTLSGDGATDAVAAGARRISWNVGADHPGVAAAAFTVDVTAVPVTAPAPGGNGTYMVIDLSGGTGASGYPVSYLDAVPAGGWTDEYKMTKLVLRRIPAGIFTMGSPSDELGRYDSEDQHQVTISRPFYMGVFEVTQKQWELVMGAKPSYFSNASYYATRPVECVSYNNIRGSSNGAKWPSSSDVDTTSFMGKLRAKTGLATFDLPTEAQWEYACRAGTTTALNSGKNLTGTSSCANMAEVGRYWYNGGNGYSSSCTTSAGTAKVGSYLPNAWGLYDMHGNVWEWCLDWWTSNLGTTAVTDPVGAASGSNRLLRGGSWDILAQYCRSANRYNNSYPSNNGRNSYGFRLCCSAGL